MGERIRQLEDALAIFQFGISDAKHPLLSDEKLLAVKFANTTKSLERPHRQTNESDGASVADAGILAVKGGELKYYGANAGSELFLGTSPALKFVTAVEFT
jgi:hypothetical protein